MIGKLGGRKFLVALVTLLVVVISATTGIDLEPYKEIVIGVTSSYLLAQGVADGWSGGATSTTKKE